MSQYGVVAGFRLDMVQVVPPVAASVPQGPHNTEISGEPPVEPWLVRCISLFVLQHPRILTWPIQAIEPRPFIVEPRTGRASGLDHPQGASIRQVRRAG